MSKDEIDDYNELKDRLSTLVNNSSVIDNKDNYMTTVENIVPLDSNSSVANYDDSNVVSYTGSLVGHNSSDNYVTFVDSYGNNSTITSYHTMGEVPITASGLALTILGTINVQDLRCDSRGDQYAQAIFNNGSGYYDKLKKSFVNIATLCNKTLKNKKIDVASIKSNLKNAKKKAMSQSQSCEQRKIDMQKIYSQTKDIFTILK